MNLITVMIWFSTQGIDFILVAQGRELTEKGTLVREGVLIYFLTKTRDHEKAPYSLAHSPVWVLHIILSGKYKWLVHHSPSLASMIFTIG